MAILPLEKVDTLGLGAAMDVFGLGAPVSYTTLGAGAIFLGAIGVATCSSSAGALGCSFKNNKIRYYPLECRTDDRKVVLKTYQLIFRLSLGI